MLALCGGYFISKATNMSGPKEAASRATNSVSTPIPKATRSRAAVVSATQTDAAVQSETQKQLAEIDNAMQVVNEQTLPLLTAKLLADDRQVRQAAVSNLVALADRAAVPALSEAANRVTDSEEKANILKAVEFLQLPSYDELVANGTMKAPGKVPMSVSRINAESYLPRPSAKVEPAGQ
ncbi:MAG: HEAT repeat domain-containing protein [Limisphaerales bacterium]